MIDKIQPYTLIRVLVEDIYIYVCINIAVNLFSA